METQLTYEKVGHFYWSMLQIICCVLMQRIKRLDCSFACL